MYKPGKKPTLSGPPKDAVKRTRAAAEGAAAKHEPKQLAVQFRHEAFATMLESGIPSRGSVQSHGAYVGDKWHENVWTYWCATEGEGPATWVLTPMKWDMHTRWAKAWKGVFSAKLEPDAYRSPFATADRVYITKREPVALTAAVAFRNPFGETVQTRIEGNLRIRKTEKGVDVFVYVRNPDGSIEPITSTLDPHAIGWNGHAGATKRDREYLRLNARVALKPGALLVFAGHISPKRLATAKGRDIFELFADNDRWGPSFRPNIKVITAE